MRFPCSDLPEIAVDGFAAVAVIYGLFSIIY
jgi:hypothetical protein